MNNLSNVEFILLTLINEKKKISGYELNVLIQERHFRDWADIGTTSIYIGLKKLKNKNFVNSHFDHNKMGKGPISTKFSISGSGISHLRKEALEALSESKSNDIRFDLAISTMDIFPAATILNAILKRKKMLCQDKIALQEKIKNNQDFKKHEVIIFNHALSFIESEISFLDSLSNKIN